jgi:nucleoside-diphosphate-sugar epimerase
MRILVVGATGVLGRNVIPRLLERGHAVRAVVRRTEQAGILRGLGVETAPGDILDQDSLYASARGCDAALHLATAIPRGAVGDWSANDRIRREGTRNLLSAAALAHVPRYLQQSITFLYGDTGTAVVDESTPIQPSSRIQSAADMEELVRGAPLEWIILRGGSFYGPGTGHEDDWRAQARAGTLRLPGDGSALLSLIHVADMARAVVLAVESARARTIANVVDDQPVSYRALYGFIAAQAGMPEPPAGGPPTASLACANGRIKELLGWQPAYPTYRSGLA